MSAGRIRRATCVAAALCVLAGASGCTVDRSAPDIDPNGCRFLADDQDEIDVIPPIIESSDPADGASGVSTSLDRVVLSMSEPIDPSTVAVDSLALLPADKVDAAAISDFRTPPLSATRQKDAIAGRATVSDDGLRVTFEIEEALAAGTAYTLLVAPKLRDEWGNPIVNPVTCISEVLQVPFRTAGQGTSGAGDGGGGGGAGDDAAADDDVPVSCATGVVVNEVMADGPSGAGADDAGEFVEIWNLSGAPVDLAGWELAKKKPEEAEFTTQALAAAAGGATTVPAGGYALAVRSTFNATFFGVGAGVPLLTLFGRGLVNSSQEEIELRCGGTLISRYGGWLANRDGRSHERIDPCAADSAANWATADPAAPYSPGEANSNTTRAGATPCL